ncbi:hypothetical protein QBC35DRAFT_373714 [Podospora australis]|uniref:Uncharacterized protein n=1 Tax=Podospora australis TaxID=1536484 RepID=A0AAN6X1Z8_9PEZI|nr:hypothetical protein QBC35DRAFT_373714 [Podospora australis]
MSAVSEASFVIHGPPDFPQCAEILGVCGVPDRYATNDTYGWIVCDFIGFKNGFHGVCERDAQTWLSSADITKFISTSGVEVDMDLVSEKILGRDGKQMRSLSTKNDEFISELLHEIAQRAKRADQRGTALVIMMFAPTTPEQDICVDFDDVPSHLSTERIVDTIREAIGHSKLRVTLMTPSALTAGWLCRPSLMGAPGCSYEGALKTVAKSCGAAFADSFIKLFCSWKNPHLSDEDRKKAKYDDLMPLSPTAEQTGLFHELRGQVHELLEAKLTSFGRVHSLQLNGADAWEDYAPRLGQSIDYWKAKLPDTLPLVEFPRLAFLGEAFGGMLEPQLWHLRYLVRLEHQTCSGDWTNNCNGITRGLFNNFMDSRYPDESLCKRVYDTLEYRSSLMTIVHCIAQAMGLPKPDSVKCRYWVDSFNNADEDLYSKMSASFGEVHNLFDGAAVLPREIRHDFKVVRFMRPSRWISEVVAHKFTDGSRDEVKKFVLTEVADFIETLRNAQLSLLTKDRSITDASINWLRSIGFAVKEANNVPAGTIAIKSPPEHAKVSTTKVAGLNGN